MKLELKEQFLKIKNNWLLIVILVAVFILISAANSGQMMYSSLAKSTSVGTTDLMYADSARGGAVSSIYPTPSSDFAPEVQDRLIIKTAYLTDEIARGEFQQAETDLKAVVKSSDSYLLNENVNKYETGRKSYYSGYYTIKVEVSKYDSVVSQLKKLGEAKSFNENQEDITGYHTNLETELAAEKSRLERYNEMYSAATSVSDKIELSDKIFDEERLIKYYEDAISNLDRGVQYSTIYFTMNEKQSDYASIEFLKLGDIARSMVNSFNFLIKLVFIILPWVVIAWLISFAYKRFKKR